MSAMNLDASHASSRAGVWTFVRHPLRVEQFDSLRVNQFPLSLSVSDANTVPERGTPMPTKPL
jgi:hypothetical protein